MNHFDFTFFEKYTPEGQKIQHIVHQHWIKILGKIFLLLFLGVLIPVFIYYFSFRAKNLIPFMALEVYLFIIYIKIIYDIFDWYNDVWIITNHGVIDLDWSIFKTKMSTIGFANIEGMEVEQDGIIDKILKKGDLIIHKIGDDSFVLVDCINPFNALNKVEHIKNFEFDKENGGDRFNLIMDTLGGVVENYLQNNHPIDNEETRKKDNIKKYKRSENSIDLR